MNMQQSNAGGHGREDAADAVAAGSAPIDDDTSIIEDTREPSMRGPGGEPLRVEVGAEVYSSDGEAVAVVEIVGPETIGIRAGSPGRSIVVPTSGIARVAPDGRRVELYASTRQVHELSGANQPGAKHLEAQQPQTLAHDEGGSVGPAESRGAL
jgi:hypothetical protein